MEFEGGCYFKLLNLGARSSFRYPPVVTDDLYPTFYWLMSPRGRYEARAFRRRFPLENFILAFEF